MTFTGFPAVVALFVFLAVPLAAVTLIIAVVSRTAHRKRHLITNTIIAEYEPPAGLSPAEIGYLFDSRFGKTELHATLVDLEQRGLVNISHSGLDGLRIEKTIAEVPSGLRVHELFVLNSLTGNTNLSMYSLKMLAGFKRSVKQSLVRGGYINRGNEIVSYYAQRTFVAYYLITAPLFLWFLFSSEGNFFAALIGLIILSIVAFPFFLLLALVVGFIYNKLVGQPGLWTAKLKKMWPQLEGYRDFVIQVELDELQFESEDLKMHSKNKAMPYAIALGLNTNWQKRFK